MLRIYKTIDNELNEVQEEIVSTGCWFHLVKPNSEEINTVSTITGVPIDFLSAALDENENSRIELEDDCILVIINIPLIVDKNSFDTLPLGIILTKNHIITVSLKDNKVVDSFTSTTTRNFSTNKRAKFLFQMFLKSAEFYLRYMRYINHLTDEIEISLRKSMKNKSLFQLFELERSLVYFMTALKDNRIVTEKILRLQKNINFKELLTIDEDDEEILEDVIIENKQAIEMVEMQSNVLSGMMNVFASIISNNLNVVMKFLTTVTILLAIPTMISSFWGMNVDVPFKEQAGGFIFVSLLASFLTLILAIVLWRKKMF